MKHEFNGAGWMRTVLAAVALSAPGLLAETPEVKAVITYPAPGTAAAAGTSIHAELRGVMHSEVEVFRCYVDSELIQTQRSPPYKNNFADSKRYAPGMHLAIGKFQLKDGSVHGAAIPFVTGPQKPEYLDAASGMKDQGELYRLADRILEAENRYRITRIEYEGLSALLKQREGIPPVLLLRDIPLKSQENLRSLLASLEAGTGKLKEQIAALRKGHAKEISAAENTPRSKYKGRNSADFLDAKGYNGRYVIYTTVKGVNAIESGPYKDYGANFFTPYPQEFLNAEEILRYAAPRSQFATVFLSRIPDSRDRDRFPTVRSPGHGNFTRDEYRWLAWKYPETMLTQIDEWGMSRNWVVNRPPRKVGDRLDADQLFIDAVREFLDYWSPAGIGVFAWDNFGVPGPQFEGGCDLFLTQLFRGQHINSALANLRGDAKAYRKKFAVSVTEWSWLPSALDWGVLSDNQGTAGEFARITSAWRDKLPRYAEEDYTRLYQYSFFSGATAVGHEAWPRPPLKQFAEFLKKHPRIGFPENKIAILRGIGDSCALTVTGDDARAYGTNLTWNQDPYGLAAGQHVSEWGPHSHIRDFELLNVFYPDFGNAFYTARQFTGAPYGPIDMLYGRAPFRPEDYTMILMISVNIMNTEQAERLKKFVAGGGTLLLNTEQCLGRDGTFSGTGADFLREVCGVLPGPLQPEHDGTVRFISAQKFGFPLDARYRAASLPLRELKLVSATPLAVMDDSIPVCTVRNYGRGQVYLTASQWHWRLPKDFTLALIGKIADAQPQAAALSGPSRKIEVFVNRFQDGSGATVAVFNNQNGHTDLPHYRKTFTRVSEPIPGTAGKSFHIVLDDDKEKKIRIDFGKTIDFKKFDEFVMRLRADGPKPGGSFNVAFFDNTGKSAAWPYGQIRVGKLDQQGWFTRYTTPQYFNRSKVGHIQSEKGFDWNRVSALEIRLLRDHSNPKLEYTLRLQEFALENLMVHQPTGYQRSCIPFRGEISVNAAALGIDPGKARVFSAGTDWNLKPVASRAEGGKLLFHAEVPADWAEYVIRK